MQLNQILLTVLDKEAVSTRKLLACVPDDKLGWKPHEKSMTLGRLSAHVAELPHWVNRALDVSDFDMATLKFTPAVAENNKELLELFESKLAAAKQALENADDETLQQMWTLRRGDFVVVQEPKFEAIQSRMMNHQVHHRGQLSVYLRLLEVVIPGMYGPSADDIIAREKAAALAAKS